MQSDFAVLAETKEFALFKAINADVFFVENEQDASDKLKRIASKYRLVLVSENLFEILNEQIKAFEEKPYPIFVCLPEIKKSGGFAIKNLVRKAKTSLGLDIFKENL